MAVATAKQIIDYITKAYNEKWGYVWGLNGSLYTQELANKYKAAKRSTMSARNPETYWTIDCKKWIGKMAADCSGLIVGAIRTVTPNYSDRTANTFKSQFTKSGTISTIPNVPGLAVWRSGHIGIYIGNGEVIEARGTEYGVVKTKLAQRDFTHWGYIKDVDYSNTTITQPQPTQPTQSTQPAPRNLKLMVPYMRGDDVKALQNTLIKAGYNCGTPDGIFGVKTENAVKQFQKDKGLVVDGIVGAKTRAKLGI